MKYPNRMRIDHEKALEITLEALHVYKLIHLYGWQNNTDYTISALDEFDADKQETAIMRTVRYVINNLKTSDRR